MIPIEATWLNRPAEHIKHKGHFSLYLPAIPQVGEGLYLADAPPGFATFTVRSVRHEVKAGEYMAKIDIEILPQRPPRQSPLAQAALNVAEALYRANQAHPRSTPDAVWDALGAYACLKEDGI